MPLLRKSLKKLLPLRGPAVTMTGPEPSLRVLSASMVDHQGLEPEPSCGTGWRKRALHETVRSLGSLGQTEPPA